MELRERDLGAFFDAPFDAYGPDTFYVSPMQSDLELLGALFDATQQRRMPWMR